MSTPAKELKLSVAGTAQGRAELQAWERSQPSNFYETDQHLQSLLAFYWGEQRLQQHVARLREFGAAAATVVDQAVQRANQPENLPRLERWSAVGERTEDVIHSQDHHLAGKFIYGSGTMSVYGQPGSNLLAQALFYLSSYNGEAGHNCPLACTAGVIKTLQFAASEELKASYLSRLLDENYDTRWHGAQFLTEVQGGSDVGANAVTATLRDGQWWLNGEKWFCSNVTADLALVTARPDGAAAGTRGLGLFLVPRKLEDGTPNGMYIRRLKDKLGTKSLATAEVDFKDAFAYQIGAPGKGFQQAMDFVVNTSRLYNAVGSAAAGRRAYVIAWTYAQQRRAFGVPLKDLPLVQQTLTEMRATTMALTAGSLYLAHLRDEIETGNADDAARQFFRLAVNLNKYRSSFLATGVVRQGIELLGGNGAMENFSVLPRLLRDCVIFEAWEGAHNTLLAQSVRDIQRYKLDAAFCQQLADWFAGLGDAVLRERGRAEVAALRQALQPLHEMPDAWAGALFKPLADRLMWLFYCACLAREAEQDDNKRVVLDWLWLKTLGQGQPESADTYVRQLSEISALL